MERTSDKRRRKPAVVLDERDQRRLCELYVRGVKGPELARRFGIGRTSAYNILREHGCLKRQVKDRGGAGEAEPTPEELDQAARAMKGAAADAAVVALPEDAGLAQAARAAAQAAIAHLREAEPNRAYSYGRVAGMLERLDRAGAPARGGGAGASEDPTEPGRRAALDFLREKLGLTRPQEAGGPSTPSGSPSPSQDDGEETR